MASFSYLVTVVLLGSVLNSCLPVAEAYWQNMGVVNVAEYQTFGVACGAGQNLNINFARYAAETNWNCGADVTHQLRSLCPGTKCSFIQVSNSNLGSDPCPGQFKALHFSYYCN